MAEADSGDLSADWLKRRAAKLALDNNLSRDAVHGMTLGQFAALATGGRLDPGADEDNGSSAPGLLAQVASAVHTLMAEEKREQPVASDSTPYDVDEAALLIRIDGASLPVSPEGARMARLLVDANGEWVSMRDHDFTKPSEVKSKLPDQVREHIETAKGKGYRLKRRITGA